jgi:hypothetical protein
LHTWHCNQNVRHEDSLLGNKTNTSPPTHYTTNDAADAFSQHAACMHCTELSTKERASGRIDFIWPRAKQQRRKF